MCVLIIQYALFISAIEQWINFSQKELAEIEIMQSGELSPLQAKNTTGKN